MTNAADWQPVTDTDEMLNRLDAAIERCQITGDVKATESLARKRSLLLAGESFMMRQINEEAVRLIGREIAAWTRNTQTFNARWKAKRR